MHRNVARIALIGVVSLLLACGGDSTLDLTVPDVGDLGTASAAKRPSPGGGGKGNAPHEVGLLGDIQGTFAASLSSKDPLQSARLENVTLTFAGVTGLGCQEDTYPGQVFADTWGGYSTGSWTGSLDVQVRKGKGGTHVGFLGASSDGGFINLAVNHRAEKSSVGNSTVLTFTNATALVGAGSMPCGNCLSDSDDRCVSFQITATPQQ